jgi:hypothetical protein
VTLHVHDGKSLMFVLNICTFFSHVQYQVNANLVP